MARRRTSTASAWSRIASRATGRLPPVEKLSDGAHGRGVEHGEAALLDMRDLEVALAHAAMKGEIHLLEGVERAIADALHALRGIEVEEQGQIGHHAARRESIEIADGFEVHPAPEALVGQGRVGVAIGNDDGAAGESRANHLRHVLLPRRHEEEGLREWGGRRSLLLEEATNGRAKRGAVRLTGEDNFMPSRAQPLSQEATMSRLAGAFNALDGDEDTAHGGNSNTLK